MDGVWPQIAAAVRSEFSDLRDVDHLTRVTLRLVVAVLLGAAIGWERETKHSAAGLRTHMLVALGAALFVLVPQQAGLNDADLGRVIQGVVAGIGFLGAGAVLKRDNENQIRGLTTAATIWATAAIGVAVGMGREATAVLATAIVLGILALLYRLGRRIEARAERRDAPDGPP